MAIEGFNYQAFAKDLAGQANGVIPPEIQGPDRQYIVNLIYNFCNMAGEALYNDTSHPFTVDEACLITQFIGEWAFHKSIDLIKSDIMMEYRDGIMQKVAFTVFEMAKTSVINKLEQQQMIELVEHHVKKTFDAEIQKLKETNVITEEIAQKATTQSNIDDMAATMDDDNINNVSDNKILKLAAFAILLKKMPKEKASMMLSKFPKEDADIIVQYLQMNDLEAKLDKNIMLQCLNEIKINMPKSKIINPNKVFKNLCKIVKQFDITQMANIIKLERPMIRDLVVGAFKQERNNIPVRILEIVSRHIEEQLT